MGKMDGFNAHVRPRIWLLFPFIDGNFRVQAVGEEEALGQVGMQIAHSHLGMKSNAYAGGR